MRGGRTKFILAFSILLGPFHGVHADPFCGVLLSSPDREAGFGETDHFTAYLEDLLDRRLMNDKQLSDLISGLDRGEIINPFQDEKNSAAEIQGEGIQNYIDGASLDQDRLLDWAERRLAERNQTREKRHLIHEITQSPFQKIELYPVRFGSFYMGDAVQMKVNLTYPIEVMSTQVTQGQWLEIMGENPSFFTNGKDSIFVNLNGRFVELQPEHPVENVTWWSALVFANKLSEKHGLTPAYDLSWMDWESGTKAEDGSLRATQGEVRINATGVPDDSSLYYRAEGYRLPTEAEQEYLLRAGGDTIGRYHFGDDHHELEKYAWYRVNSKRQTHPVAQLKPLILNGEAFFDLHGNVNEWGWDWYGELKAGQNPTGPKVGSDRVARGGSENGPELDLRSGRRQCHDPNERAKTLGFRLVRTLRVSEERDEKN